MPSVLSAIIPRVLSILRITLNSSEKSRGYVQTLRVSVVEEKKIHSAQKHENTKNIPKRVYDEDPHLRERQLELFVTTNGRKWKVTFFGHDSLDR